jgi:glutaredoxin
MFKIYYLSYCPYSQKALKTLKKITKDVKEINEIECDANRSMCNVEKDYHTFPKIYFIDNNKEYFIGGNSDLEQILNLLNKIKKNANIKRSDYNQSLKYLNNTHNLLKVLLFIANK